MATFGSSFVGDPHRGRGRGQRRRLAPINSVPASEQPPPRNFQVLALQMAAQAAIEEAAEAGPSNPSPVRRLPYDQTLARSDPPPVRRMAPVAVERTEQSTATRRLFPAAEPPPIGRRVPVPVARDLESTATRRLFAAADPPPIRRQAPVPVARDRESTASRRLFPPDVPRHLRQRAPVPVEWPAESTAMRQLFPGGAASRDDEATRFPPVDDEDRDTGVPALALRRLSRNDRWAPDDDTRRLFPRFTARYEAAQRDEDPSMTGAPGKSRRRTAANGSDVSDDSDTEDDDDEREVARDARRREPVALARRLRVPDQTLHVDGYGYLIGSDVKFADLDLDTAYLQDTLDMPDTRTIDRWLRERGYDYRSEPLFAELSSISAPERARRILRRLADVFERVPDHIDGRGYITETGVKLADLKAALASDDPSDFVIDLMAKLPRATAARKVARAREGMHPNAARRQVMQARSIDEELAAALSSTGAPCRSTSKQARMARAYYG